MIVVGIWVMVNVPSVVLLDGPLVSSVVVVVVLIHHVYLFNRYDEYV